MIEVADEDEDERWRLGLFMDVPARVIPSYDRLCFDDCLNKHIIPNKPFILSSNSTSAWPSRQNWASHPSDSSIVSLPNFYHLRQYADHLVPVADTLTRQFSEFSREDRRLGDILDLWEQGQGKELYVKDWHLIDEIEKSGGLAKEIYAPPECLRDDWLNPPFHLPPYHHTSPTLSPCPNNVPTDFRFTYMGPTRTFTPLHRDVYASYSWSANIVGRKLWWLYPPDSDALNRVKDKNGELVFDVRKIEGEGGGIKVVQQEGEVIFVPSGWYHQVINLDFCISINHNFFSSPTLPHIYNAMSLAQTRVEESIADVADMIKERYASESESSRRDLSRGSRSGTSGSRSGRSLSRSEASASHQDSIVRDFTEVDEEEIGLNGWEKEWINEVQNLLELDSGWGWKGFWQTVKRNILTSPAPPQFSVPVETRNKFVLTTIKAFKTRREWIVLDDVRQLVLDIEAIISNVKSKLNCADS